ncbi:MAG: hypothetical protein GXY20_03895 [Clostridiales bacterium]|nr:hypothetical protein [Clostridiales bacterium]
MCESCGDRYNYELSEERFEDAFAEVCNDIWNHLRSTDSEYAEMWRELLALMAEFPVLSEVTEGEGAVSLSAEEHKAFLHYLDLKNEMENIERKHIYFCGHRHSFDYLKRIGAI